MVRNRLSFENHLIPGLNSENISPIQLVHLIDMRVGGYLVGYPEDQRVSANHFFLTANCVHNKETFTSIQPGTECGALNTLEGMSVRLKNK